MTEPDPLPGLVDAIAELRVGKTTTRHLRHLAQDFAVEEAATGRIVARDGSVYRTDGDEGPRWDASRRRWRDLELPDPGRISAAWRGAVSLPVDDRADASGLRRAQRGAVHAVVAHLTTSSTRPATVVMPTGTGKTEAMLTLAVAMAPRRLLVVVPGDSLRTQTATKFETLGLLAQLGIVPAGTPRPVVGTLRGGIRDGGEAAAFADRCNVVISTPNAVAACSTEARAALVAGLDAVFFDEAHHVRAASWSRIRDDFAGKPVVQFTATPFREDGQPLGGDFVYSFPLREAQRDAVFSRIVYRSVFDLINPDEAIAAAAVESLRLDLEAGRDHLLMARCRNVVRAADVHTLYARLASDLGSVQVHTGIGGPAAREALGRLRDRSARIVVCVDMLGEGFDLPELKIAALHDPKRSLGPTLQLVGRFARVKPTVGDATVVVARDERLLDHKLRRLYSEDPDWNHVIEALSYEAVEEQREISAFENRFGGDPVIATSSVAPKMSTVVYTTTCEDWQPDRLIASVAPDDLVTVPVPVNHVDHVLWFARRRVTGTDWSDAPVADVVHELWIYYWDASRGLLYINSSGLGGVFEDEAELLCPGSRLVKGEQVFRVFGRIQRPVPTNVGVLDIYNRARRFSMHSGADVTAGFPAAEQATKVQTNIFVTGFTDGERTTAGASIKGRIWSYQAARHIKHWTEWCDHIGGLVTDANIEVSEMKKNFIQPETLDNWPDDLVPLALEWPTDVLVNTSDALRLVADGKAANLYELDLAVAGAAGDQLQFTISAEEWSRAFALMLTADGMSARSLDGLPLTVETGRRTMDAAAFLSAVGLVVLMSGDAIVSPPGVLFRSRRDALRIDPSDLEAWDWAGIALNKESRGPSADPATIQGRTLDWLLAQSGAAVIVDDDGKGEVADLVALSTADGNYLEITLFHCKYATGGTVGQRVGDLYELCGQAMRSAVWRRQPEEMLRRLIRRERHRIAQQRRSGLERGAVTDLVDLMHQLPSLQPRLHVVLVQPGLSVSGFTNSQSELLGSTQTYLAETAAATMRVIGSP